MTAPTTPTSPADTLREAATLIRERANAAGKCNPGPWLIDPLPNYVDDHEVRDADNISVAYSETGHNASMDKPTAEHIAGMHPAVAVAVADWLDVVAKWINRGDCSRADELGSRALTVARTYLGHTQ